MPSYPKNLTFGGVMSYSTTSHWGKGLCFFHSFLLSFARMLSSDQESSINGGHNGSEAKMAMRMGGGGFMQAGYC